MLEAGHIDGRDRRVRLSGGVDEAMNCALVGRLILR